ncbi:MAG: tRNA pseudouridine(38-40) synthase TruA [Pseudomonadota bacterium]
MHRYRMTIEYDGTPYVGWQRQTNGHAVQAAVEKAILGFTHENVTLQVAGRTDTGVHALGQTAHADLTRDWAPEKVLEATNAFLAMNEERVSIVACQKVDETFHARFSAQARHYLYRITNRVAPNALEHRRAWWIKKPLDLKAMRDASNAFIGTHDFTTFRAAQCQAKSPVKTLDKIVLEREGHEISIHVSARSFLHNQVRSIVGTLKMVGENRWDRSEVERRRDALDHQLCGALAPPHGLYLKKVDYREAKSPAQGQKSR